jgi:hypothetical protein
VKEVGLNNILPSHCYPLEGQIILREKIGKNIVLIGVFRINKDSDIIDIRTSSGNIYPKYEKNGDNKGIYITPDTFKPYYDYELVALQKLMVGGVETNNLCITGTGKLNGDFDLTFGFKRDEIRCSFQPLFNENGNYCDLRVW